MTNLCPVCGQDAANSPSHVSEEALAGIINGQGVTLGHVEARILSILLKASPDFVTTDRLLELVYGGKREPEYAEGVIKHSIHRLKVKIAPAARIEGRRIAGYRLVAQ